MSYTNYPRFYHSKQRATEFLPLDHSQLGSMVRSTRLRSQRLRVIGRAHSLHMGNLPRSGEIVVRLDNFNEFCFVREDLIRVGTGVDIRSLQEYLRLSGVELPVINGGNGSPTLGGFICAGGIGKTEEQLWNGRSSLYGGFWENVESLTVMNGTGAIKKLAREDQEFIWHFGGQGQFGILLEAELYVIGSENESANRLREELRCTIGQKRRISPYRTNTNLPKIFWVSVLVREKDLPQAWKILELWVEENRSSIFPVEEARWSGPEYNGKPLGYSYDIRYISRHPPMLWNEECSFKVIGVAFVIPESEERTPRGIKEIFSNVYKELLEAGFRLYISVENVNGEIRADDYYCPEVINKARKLRADNYCSGFLNCGWLDEECNMEGIVSLI